MRRVVGVLIGASLAVAASFAIAHAAGTPLTASSSDIGSALMLRIFGEATDFRASFAAERGDRSGESPLHQLALQISPSERTQFIAGTVTPTAPVRSGTLPQGIATLPNLTDALNAGVFSAGDSFVALPGSHDDLLTRRYGAVTATYQPVGASPQISPAPGTLAFDAAPASGQATQFAPVSMHVGSVAFQGNVAAGSSDTPALSLHDNVGGASANFQLPAGKRDINLNVTTQYEHLFRNDSGFSAALGSAPSWQLPDANLPLVVPSYADLNKVSVGAGLAVPVVRGLSLNLNYGVEHVYGGYGLPGLVNLDTVNNSYGGKLTFDIPDASKTLSISAYQERFTDSLLPLNGATQTREDVNFTVKF